MTYATQNLLPSSKSVSQATKCSFTPTSSTKTSVVRSSESFGKTVGGIISPTSEMMTYCSHNTKSAYVMHDLWFPRHYEFYSHVKYHNDYSHYLMLTLFFLLDLCSAESTYRHQATIDDEVVTMEILDTAGQVR